MFYSFWQNNSGGSFMTTNDLARRVWIEADTKEEAIEKAERRGMYSGYRMENGDCPCCGERWSLDPMDEEPMPTEYCPSWLGRNWTTDTPATIIHAKDEKHVFTGMEIAREVQAMRRDGVKEKVIGGILKLEVGE